MAPTDRRRAPKRRAVLGWAAGVSGIAALGGGAGCEAFRGEAVPELPLWHNRPGGALSIVFRRLLTDKTKIEDQPYERGRPAIDPQNLRVFVGSQDGGLYAVDARNGEILWRFATKGPVQCEPLYDEAGDAVFFGSTDGALYKVRGLDGKLLFRFASNAEVARRPVLVGDTLYFVNGNDTLVAIDQKTGKLKWYQNRTPAFGIEVAGYAGCAVGGGRVFASFSDGAVMAYSTADGSEQWPTVDLSLEAQAQNGQAPQYLDADATPVLGRVANTDAVVVAHFEGGVYALEAQTGRTLWRNAETRGVTHLVLWEQPAHKGRLLPGTTVSPDVPARRVLLASSGQTGLWGLDVETGAMLWRNKLPEGGISAPVPISGAVLVSTTRYGIFLFEPTRGGVIDGIAPGNEIAMTPAAFGQHAYVMTNGGELMALLVRPPIDLKKKG